MLNERLAFDPQETPDWLRAHPRLDAEIAKKFLAERTAFYPGSGSDLHTLDVFGRSDCIHCFVHADYLWQCEAQQLNGYRIVLTQQIDYPSLCRIFELDGSHPFGGSRTRHGNVEAIRNGTSLWVVYQQSVEVAEVANSKYFALLHVCAEAIWIYWNFWSRCNFSPYGILLQDHGMGGNWTKFGYSEEADTPLFALANASKAFPNWALVGDNTNCWPSYDLDPSDISNAVEVGAMHAHIRHLFRRRRE